MLRFAANLSLLFTELPLLERFAAARAAGFTAVEIQFPYELDVATLQTQLRTHDLQLVLINVPAGDLMSGGDGLAGVPGRETEFQAALQDALRYAEALQVPTVNMLPGRRPEGADPARCWDTLVGNLRLAAEALQGIGVTAVVEAINSVDMPRFCVSDLTQLLALQDAVAHPNLKLQFDIYHMARMGEDVAGALRDHIARIGHIQFADLPGRGAPGSGTLDFAALFALIEQLPYTGWCGAEYRPSGPSQNSLDWFTPWRKS